MENTAKLESLAHYLESNYVRFREEFYKSPDFASAAPGRINIIGEHTDYNQGLAMPAAIDRWVIINFSGRKDGNINIRSQNYKSQISFSVDHTPIIAESWQKYIFGAFSLFKEVAEVNHGFDAYVWGNVPVGAGVSSSAAMEVAIMNGLRTMYGANLDDLTLVKMCQKVEHDFLGVKSGLLDQYASQFSKAGKVMVLDFKELRHQYVDIDMGDLEWVLVDSKVRRELADSAYSERVKESCDALKFLKNKIFEIQTFRDLKEEYLELLPNENWKKRLRHYLSENKRVVEGMDCIQKKDFFQLGSEKGAICSTFMMLIKQLLNCLGPE